MDIKSIRTKTVYDAALEEIESLMDRACPHLAPKPAGVRKPTTALIAIALSACASQQQTMKPLNATIAAAIEETSVRMI